MLIRGEPRYEAVLIQWRHIFRFKSNWKVVYFLHYVIIDIIDYPTVLTILTEFHYIWT